MSERIGPYQSYTEGAIRQIRRERRVEPHGSYRVYGNTPPDAFKEPYRHEEAPCPVCGRAVKFAVSSHQPIEDEKTLIPALAKACGSCRRVAEDVRHAFIAKDAPAPRAGLDYHAMGIPDRFFFKEAFKDALAAISGQHEGGVDSGTALAAIAERDMPAISLRLGTCPVNSKHGPLIYECLGPEGHGGLHFGASGAHWNWSGESARWGYTGPRPAWAEGAVSAQAQIPLVDEGGYVDPDLGYSDDSRPVISAYEDMVRKKHADALMKSRQEKQAAPAKQDVTAEFSCLGCGGHLGVRTSEEQIQKPWILICKNFVEEVQRFLPRECGTAHQIRHSGVPSSIIVSAGIGVASKSIEVPYRHAGDQRAGAPVQADGGQRCRDQGAFGRCSLLAAHTGQHWVRVDRATEFVWPTLPAQASDGLCSKVDGTIRCVEKAGHAGYCHTPLGKGFGGPERPLPPPEEREVRIAAFGVVLDLPSPTAVRYSRTLRRQAASDADLKERGYGSQTAGDRNGLRTIGLDQRIAESKAIRAKG